MSQGRHAFHVCSLKAIVAFPEELASYCMCLCNDANKGRSDRPKTVSLDLANEEDKERAVFHSCNKSPAILSFVDSSIDSLLLSQTHVSSIKTDDLVWTLLADYLIFRAMLLDIKLDHKPLAWLRCCPEIGMRVVLDRVCFISLANALISRVRSFIESSFQDARVAANLWLHLVDY